MVSSFNLWMAVVNGRKELSHSVSNQWPHINTPLLPPPKGNYTALLPPLLIMCLRQFFLNVFERKEQTVHCALWVRKKDSGHSRINHRADWAVAHSPLSPRPSSCYSFIYLFFSFYFFWAFTISFHSIPLGLTMHFTDWANWVNTLNIFLHTAGFDRSRVEEVEDLPAGAVSRAVTQLPD